MTIFVGVDGSPGSEVAVRWAVREGELRGCAVTAVLACDPRSQSSESDAEARAALDVAVVQAVGSEAAPRVDRRVVCDAAWDALVSASAGADLLVVGARGNGGFLGLRLGSVSDRCLRRAECPIAIIPTDDHIDDGRPEHIVVGVDGSDSSRHALDWALDEARRRRAKVEAATAWHVLVPGIFASGYALEASAFEDDARLILAVATEDADTTGLPEPLEGRVVAGPAAGAILDLATDATLIVVGSRGLGGFKGLLLGSVSQQVAHHAPCPVVVVPSERGSFASI